MTFFAPSLPLKTILSNLRYRPIPSEENESAFISKATAILTRNHTSAAGHSSHRSKGNAASTASPKKRSDDTWSGKYHSLNNSLLKLYIFITFPESPNVMLFYLA